MERKPDSPVTASQAELALIPHKVEGRIVQQRAVDGYINATEMCRVSGKRFGGYHRLDGTKAFLDALEADVQICTSALVQSVRGGPPELQGTWVHPQVAIHLAMWLRPKFAVQVTRWVFEWMTGRLARDAFPDHIRRYAINQQKIPANDFSMLNQMIFRLLGPMEIQGYTMPVGLMPDIALGKMFSKWLREQGEDPDSFPSYAHEFLDGDPRPTVLARLYPNRLMTDFNEQIDLWIRDGRARKYFGERDENAIVPLDRVVAALPSPSAYPALGS